MLFEIERTSVLGRPGLSLRGELDIATAPELTDAVESQLSQAPRSLVIDLTGTTFLDSSGARVLAFAARRARAAGTALQVVCPAANRAVWMVFDLLELGALVPVVESPALTEPEVGP